MVYDEVKDPFFPGSWLIRPSLPLNTEDVVGKSVQDCRVCDHIAPSGPRPVFSEDLILDVVEALHRPVPTHRLLEFELREMPAADEVCHVLGCDILIVRKRLPQPVDLAYSLCMWPVGKALPLVEMADVVCPVLNAPVHIQSGVALGLSICNVAVHHQCRTADKILLVPLCRYAEVAATSDDLLHRFPLAADGVVCGDTATQVEQRKGPGQHPYLVCLVRYSRLSNTLVGPTFEVEVDMPKSEYFEIHDIPFKRVFKDSSKFEAILRVDVDSDGNMVLREPNQEDKRVLGLPIVENEIDERIAVELAKDPTYSW